MKQTTLSKWLKLITLGTGICGIIVCAGIIPMLADAAVKQYPEFSNCRWPWLILIWTTAVPFFAALVLFWKISTNMGTDRSFSTENARLLKWIAILAASFSCIFFSGNLIYWLIGMNHPGIILVSLLIDFLGIVASVAASVLSHLVVKAAELQDQSDLTI